MDDLFFNIDYTSFQQLMLRLIAFLLVSGALIFIIYFALSKLLFKKDKGRKEVNLRLIFLWSLLVYFILFNGYLFLLVYRNGIDAFEWESPKFYTGIAVQIVLYITLLSYFFARRQALKHFININLIS